jgi:hypothetical protein
MSSARRICFPVLFRSNVSMGFAYSYDTMCRLCFHAGLMIETIVVTM